MEEAIKILLVEDVDTDAELAVRQLRREGLKVEASRVETKDTYLSELERFKPDIILSDYSMPKFDGLSALSIAYQKLPDTPFIFLSGTIGEETAIEALKGGATDYILKTNLHRLTPAVTRALDEARMRKAHRQAESRFRDLIEFAPYAIVVINEKGLIEIVNAQVEALFCYKRDEVIGSSSEVLIPGSFQQWHHALYADAHNATNNRTILTFEVTGRRQDRTEFPAEVSLSPLNTEKGLWISCVVRDITLRKEQESRIARLSRIHTVLSGINTAIVRIRNKKRFLEEACRIAVEDGLFAASWIGMLNNDTARMELAAWAGLDNNYMMRLQSKSGGYLPEEFRPVELVLSTKTGMVISDIEQDPRIAPWRDRLLSHNYRSLCIMPLVVDGKSVGAFFLYANQPNVFNEEEQRLLATVAADISFALDHFGKEDRLDYLAYFDSVTGLPNRTLFQDRLGQLLAQEDASPRGQIAVVLLGLNRFRTINETFGRKAADELLREVARRLRENLPDPGHLARIQADCFAFVMKDTRSETDIINLLERKVALCLSEPVLFLGKDVRVSATAGIVLFPNDGHDVDMLLRNAEAALKNAKATKSDYLFYTAEMNARAAEKLSIENRLRRALDQNQFVLHYQPKVDLSSGEIVGLEALIRWEEPGIGLVHPEKFIHVLEDTGLIVEVGKWVIMQAHEQYQHWLAHDIVPPRIAVNVSQLQIRQKDFVRHITDMLSAAKPGELELEITESLFMEGADQDAAKQKLAVLRERGVTMAIDDFGTGYSSLSYIARLPIDTLKIDRSFVEDMGSSHDHMAIVSTIISLAHSLNLKVVAEGVETNEQFHLLKMLGCDQIQGFLCGRSLPPEEIELKLAKGSSAGGASGFIQ
jgi:diguanylate cyclase (GGDEF)-like protein/PAS domain S-box-containing protein